MVALSRSVKVGITASLISLFIYVAYVTRGGYIILFGYINNDPASVGYVHMLGLAYWASFIGLTGRFIGVALGIVVLLLLWVKAWPLSKVKGLVAAAIALEAVNFISLVPSVSWLLRPGLLYNEPLGIDYLLEILLIVPFLSILAGQSCKVRCHKQAQFSCLGVCCVCGLRLGFSCQRRRQMDQHDFHGWLTVSFAGCKIDWIFKRDSLHALRNSLCRVGGVSVSPWEGKISV